jgi:SAM-dependent methyltransferase
VALSISSFEHDGLGRYGDPVDANGDLKAMERMRRVLKPNGYLILAVPVGVDTIKWNAHRKYGRVRLPVLLRLWSLVAQVA